MPNPPDGNFSKPVVTTKGMTPEQWQAALNAVINAPGGGYPKFTASTPDPNNSELTWTSVYLSTGE